MFKFFLLKINYFLVDFSVLMFQKYSYFKVKRNKNIKIGKSFYMGLNCRIEPVLYYRGVSYNPYIRLRDNIHIENHVHIACVNLIDIGNNVLIGSNVLITDHNHGYYDSLHYELHEDPLIVPPGDRKLTIDGSIKIHENVWIGENVVILANSEIGECSIVAANSVVTGNLDAYSIYAGNPCKKIKYFDKKESKWLRYE